MTNNDKIGDEKVQYKYNINREAAKVPTLSSGKIDKYNFLRGEEILHKSDKSRIVEQAKFTYSPLSKAFEKQIKTIEDQGLKQVEALKPLKSEENKEDIKSIEGIFPKDMRSNINRNKLNKLNKNKLNKKIGRKS